MCSSRWLLAHAAQGQQAQQRQHAEQAAADQVEPRMGGGRIGVELRPGVAQRDDQRMVAHGAVAQQQGAVVLAGGVDLAHREAAELSGRRELGDVVAGIHELVGARRAHRAVLAEEQRHGAGAKIVLGEAVGEIGRIEREDDAAGEMPLAVFQTARELDEELLAVAVHEGLADVGRVRILIHQHAEMVAVAHVGAGERQAGVHEPAVAVEQRDADDHVAGHQGR